MVWLVRPVQRHDERPEVRRTSPSFFLRKLAGALSGREPLTRPPPSSINLESIAQRCEQNTGYQPMLSVCYGLGMGPPSLVVRWHDCYLGDRDPCRQPGREQGNCGDILRLQ